MAMFTLITVVGGICAILGAYRVRNNRQHHANPETLGSWIKAKSMGYLSVTVGLLPFALLSELVLRLHSEPLVKQVLIVALAVVWGAIFSTLMYRAGREIAR